MKVDSSQEGKSHDDETRQNRSKISSESEREKTKLRERKRRSITSKILYGLRKHGNYDLPPRADINDVLRALANEAGWEVEPDGTTYRKPKQQQASVTHCLAPLQQISPVAGPSLVQSGGSSYAGSFPATVGGFNCMLPSIGTDPIDLRGGDCSTTASPRHMGSSSISLFQTNSTFSSPFTSPPSSEGVPSVQVVNPFVIGAIPNGLIMPLDSFGFKDDTAASFLPADAFDPRDWTSGRALMGTASSSFLGNTMQTGNLHRNIRMTMPSIMTLPQHNPFLQESRASNHNTPIGSPQPHPGNG